jgi:hypothetical protein
VENLELDDSPKGSSFVSLGEFLSNQYLTNSSVNIKLSPW